MDLASGISAPQSKKIQGQFGYASCSWDCEWGMKQIGTQVMEISGYPLDFQQG
jgi:hypothetical protein